MRVAVIALLLACGDNTAPPDRVFTGTSGSRIKLQWYLYQDGTRQLDTAAFYDTHEQIRCEPRTWVDGVTRCTPIADPTVFTDGECTIELGRAMSDRTPRFFIGQDIVGGKPTPVRWLRAGAITTPPAKFYEKREGACIQINEPTTFAYWELPAQADHNTLAQLSPEAMDDERLAMRLVQSEDGLIAPVGFRDRQLELDCDPEVRADGTTVCVPDDVAVANHFADPFCEQRVVVAETEPRAVIVNDASGCPSHHVAAEEHTALLFRREGTMCVQTSRARAFRVGAPLELATFSRSVDAAPRRRLQRITLAAGELYTLDTRVYDSATRTDCKSYGNGELAICAPTSTVAAERLYANDKCGREVLIAFLPKVQCTKSTFAVVENASIHAISTPYVGPLFSLDLGGTCRARPATDLVPHVLGPAIPAGTFVGGVVYSER